MNINKKKIVRIINHYKRGRGYVSLARSMMIGVIFLEQFNVNRMHYCWIIPITIISLILIGYFEKHYKFYEHIKGYKANKNPVLRELLEKVTKIEKQLNDIRDKK